MSLQLQLDRPGCISYCDSVDQLSELFKQEFPQDQDIIYLNHAAVAPWPARTAKAVIEFAQENVLNGARNYPVWVKKESHLRKQVQEFLNVPSPDDIAFLKNTSEALSVVASGLDWHKGENIVSTDQEFPSNRIVWQAQNHGKVEFREININNPAPEQALLGACDKKTRVLTVSSVQFGTGYRLNLEILGQFCRENGILFCVDAIQSIGAHALNIQKIQADFVMADAHKWMLGPEGVAVFYCNQEIREQLQLHQFGWHMVEDFGNYDRKDWEIASTARRFECGSSNMLGIHALSASLSLLLDVGITKIEQLIRQNVNHFFSELGAISGIEILTPVEESRRAGIFTFRIPGKDMARLHQHLLANNIVCAHRSGGIRFSPHCYTTSEKIYKALEIIKLSI